MKARRLLIGGMAAGLTATALFLGGALRRLAERELGPGRAAAGGGRHGDADREAPGRSSAASRDDVNALDALGLAYQQRARETGDPTYYTKSDEVLRRALRLAPRDLIATSGLGSLALSRHRFREALALGRRARAISPTTARNYGVIGDALVELGRYRQGFQAFDTMADAAARRLRPTRGSGTPACCSATSPAPARRCGSRSTPRSGRARPRRGRACS